MLILYRNKQFEQKNAMFIVNKILKPSLMFVVEANVYPVGEPLRTHSEEWFLASLTWARMWILDKNKHFWRTQKYNVCRWQEFIT